MNSKPKCATIPAGKPFASILARWIAAEYGGPGREHALASVLVLVPNRRAVRSLRDAFLRQSGGRPMILPRIHPIGDMEESMLLPSQKPLPESAPMPAARRLMLLTRLVMQFEKQRQGRNYSAEHAAQLAQELARFLDDVARDGADMEKLAHLAPAELAQHWQQTLDFLKLVSRFWPEILQRENMVEPVPYRNTRLHAIAGEWQKSPPDFPVIAAGSTGSQKATAELLSVIARMPRGLVVLPAFDLGLDEAWWRCIEPTHPHYGLKQLLEQMECRREEVFSLGEADEVAERTLCLRHVFAPAPITSQWAKAKLPLKEGLGHIKLCVADTELDEARITAIALREAMEFPGKTAALITPDRTLARMVAAQMQRFGIRIDDSAGLPLTDTIPAVFLRLLAQCAQSQAAPVDMLALLSHPLCAAGQSPAACRSLGRELDREVLRGIRHSSGLEALCQDPKASEEIRRFLGIIAEPFNCFASYFNSKNEVTFSEMLQAHLECAEFMASTSEEPGSERLWKGEAAAQLAEFLSEISQHAPVLGEIDPFTYPGLFESLLAGATYRPRFGLHPRLQILSPIEARMQQFDLVVLAGANEESWPAPTAADPWMSRPMRQAFGLEPAERDIGQSAHDFYWLCHGSDVLITRSRKKSGTPAVPSRWLVRLSTLLEGQNPSLLAEMDRTNYYELAKSVWDAPTALQPLARPAPRPPLAARPRRMRVTAIDRWLRDPYAIYAEYVLGLRKLDELDQDPGAADLGTLIHETLEKFARQYPSVLPQDAYEQLLEIGKGVFAPLANRPAVAMLWWPRFEAMARWFIDQETRLRPSLAQVRTEVKGVWNCHVDGQGFTLSTRIDRLEIARDGGITIADYKTGALPSDAEIAQGLANQLALEALIAREGELEGGGISATAVLHMAYWKLASRPDQSEIKWVETDLGEVRQRLEELVRLYQNPAQAYAAPSGNAPALRYNDYAHLTRRQEWETV